MSIRDKFKTWLLESPLAKTFAFIVSVIISGILSGAFVSEITYNGVINWRNFYKAKSFYILIFFSIIVYLYIRYIYEEDIKIKKFIDKRYCKAYLRSQCLPEIAKKYKEIIRQGVKSDELKEIQDNFKRMIE